VNDLEIYTGISTAFALRSYWLALKDYFSPIIRETKKRIKGEYFEYDMESDGDLLFWRGVLKKEFYNPTDKKIEINQNEALKTSKLGYATPDFLKLVKLHNYYYSNPSGRILKKIRSFNKTEWSNPDYKGFKSDIHFD
jgi:hypothetical protein